MNSAETEKKVKRQFYFFDDRIDFLMGCSRKLPTCIMKNKKIFISGKSEPIMERFYK